MLTITLQTKALEEVEKPTWWVLIELDLLDGDDKTILSALEKELAGIDFKPEQNPPPDVVGMPAQRLFSKAGTDLFQGWTPAEHDENLAQLDNVFNKFPLVDVFEQHLTWQELV